ncbi:hypothetical protein ACWD6P_01840 [Streptomyces sp. NPDC002446]
MWLSDAVAELFRLPTDESRIQIFRMLVGAACTLKFLGELTQGTWNFLAHGSYSRFELRKLRGADAELLVCALYRPVVIARLVAALMLTAGVLPRVAAVLVALGLAFELSYLYRFNTIYLMLTVACLVFAGAPGNGFALSYARTDANTWSQFLIVLITLDMYWNSAWIKVRSAQFRSGLRMAQWLESGAALGPRLPRREYHYPAFLVRHLGNSSPAALRTWRPVSLFVIFLEVAIPVALLFPPTRPYGIAAGIIMHLCFWGLLPVTLVGFSLGSVASYVLFVP